MKLSYKRLCEEYISYVDYGCTKIMKLCGCLNVNFVNNTSSVVNLKNLNHIIELLPLYVLNKIKNSEFVILLSTCDRVIRDKQTAFGQWYIGFNKVKYFG